MTETTHSMETLRLPITPEIERAILSAFRGNLKLGLHMALYEAMRRGLDRRRKPPPVGEKVVLLKLLPGTTAQLRRLAKRCGWEAKPELAALALLNPSLVLTHWSPSSARNMVRGEKSKQGMRTQNEQQKS